MCQPGCDDRRLLVAFEHDDLGVAVLGARVQVRMHLQRAEALTEAIVLFGREFLVAEEEHLVFQPCGVDLGEGGVVEIAEIGAAHLGAERARKRPHLNAAVRHGSLRGRNLIRAPAEARSLARQIGRCAERKCVCNDSPSVLG